VAAPAAGGEHREAPLQSVRIILDGMPGMLRAMIKEIIAADAACSIVAETDDENGLSKKLKQSGADVVIIAPGSNAVGAGHYLDLLREYPRTRVLAIATSGRRAFIHELRPCVTEISELSPESLLAALRPGSFERSQGGPVNG
jgi:DNA-binding NarL/FixJ family response regulator